MSDSESTRHIKTPCVGVCSTGIGDAVCRGCKRFDYEVIRWNSYLEEEKRAIDQRLSQLLAEVVATHLVIIDVERLERQLIAHQVRYPHWQNPYCWLFALLKAGGSQIDEAQQYGFAVREVAGELSLTAIRDRIDEGFYALSVAHYERYILANRRGAEPASA